MSVRGERVAFAAPVPHILRPDLTMTQSTPILLVSRTTCCCTSLRRTRHGSGMPQIHEQKQRMHVHPTQTQVTHPTAVDTGQGFGKQLERVGQMIKYSQKSSFNQSYCLALFLTRYKFMNI